MDMPINVESVGQRDHFHKRLHYQVRSGHQHKAALDIETA
jgi:hypothetical protein